MTVGSFHIPVMLEESMTFLSPHPRGIYLDCTVGGGGHARAIMERTDGQAFLIGLDLDPQAIAHAKEVLSPFAENVTLILENFARSKEIIERLQIKALDGLICDLGVSSWQLEQKERGFSFQTDADLDMRMNPGGDFTAADIVNKWREEELRDIFLRYEVPQAERLAKHIVKRRRIAPLHRTNDLLQMLKEMRYYTGRKMHPATLLFQALRITVNRELENLNLLLSQLPALLKEGGRCVFLAYHSLEDRLVKTALRNFSREGSFVLLTAKVQRPSWGEIKENPRAASALLRAAQKREQATR